MDPAIDSSVDQVREFSLKKLFAVVRIVLLNEGGEAGEDRGGGEHEVHNVLD